MKRALRTKSVGTKVSDAELRVLESRAAAAGLTLSEWVRDVLLASSVDTGTMAAERAILAEMLAMRAILLNFLLKLSMRQPITEQISRELIAWADENKMKRALEILAKSSAREVNGVTAAPSAVAYQYSPIVWADNGNLTSATDSVLGTQSFTYDTLNRVKGASFNGSKGTFSLAWTYDAFGNRISQVPGGTSTLTFYQAAASSYNGTSLQNGTQLSGVYNNRIDGQNYDASGNMLGTATVQFTYDAASRITTAGSICYLYDAEGHRTAKGVWNGTACGSFTAQYILGLGGEQLTELDGSGNWKHTNVYDGSHLVATYDAIGTHFHLNDWLGTERAQVSANGVVDEICVDLPFGDSQTCSGPGVDATEQHFTGKIRDVESGLDYFGARYFSSNLGRWMSPDWSATVEPVPYGKLDYPQSLNLFPYVSNNPITQFDPDGHATWYDSNGSWYKNDGVSDGRVIVQAPGSATPIATFSKEEGMAIQASVSRTLDGAPGHEEGFVEDASGIHNSPPGAPYKSGDTEAVINQTTPPGTTMEEHTHPADIVPPPGTFGTTVAYQDEPSLPDKQAAAKAPGVTHVEVKAATGRVNIYNGNGVQAHLPLSAFPTPPPPPKKEKKKKSNPGT